jgi:hypothetical protein
MTAYPQWLLTPIYSMTCVLPPKGCQFHVHSVWESTLFPCSGVTPNFGTKVANMIIITYGEFHTLSVQTLCLSRLNLIPCHIKFIFLLYPTSV